MHEGRSFSYQLKVQITGSTGTEILKSDEGTVSPPEDSDDNMEEDNQSKIEID